MSFNPVCKPNELAKLKFKDYKPEVAKFVKKMYAKGHTNMESLVPIFLDVEHQFADGEKAMFIVAGKLNAWKAHIKNAISKDATQVLKGYAFALFSEETGYELKIAPVKGKMRKENILDKAFKKLVGTKAIINILAEMEENDDFENRMENVVDSEDPNAVVTTEQNNTTSPKEILTISIAAETRTVIAFYKEMRAEEELALLFGDPTDFTEAVDRLRLICELAKNFEQAPNNETRLKVRQDTANAIAGHIESYLEVCDYLPSDILKQQAVALKQLRTRIAKFATPIVASKLNVTQKQLDGETFGERGVAGEQSASEVAKAKRDAEIDEVALELAKLLNPGSNSDENFADVIRWVAVASANLKATETKYVAATEKLYQTKSTLGADLGRVFGHELRGLFIQQMLVDNVSEYASLATALGCLGKSAFARMFSGEKEDAVAIYSNYGVATIDGLISGKDAFATAAYAKLSVKQKEQITSLRGLKNSREVIDSKKDPVEKQKAQERANAASDQYLLDLSEKLDDEAGTFVSLNEDKLYKELEAWAETATDEEKAAISKPDSKFYRYLLNKKGQKEVNLALNIINKPQLDEKDDNYASNEAFFEMNKIIITQEARSSVGRWWNDRESGEAVQKLLLSDNINNPQEAIVSKFLKSKLAQFVAPFPAKATPQERQQLQLQKDAILKEAIAKMNQMLDKAAIPKEFKDTIEESILSNGARGLAYQKLAEYAKENPSKIATKVLDVLKGLDPTSVEWASIKNDTDLLTTLKRHIIKAWFSGYDDWVPIVKLLDLKGDLAANNVDVNATADKFGEKRTNSRLKVTTLAEKEKLAEQQSEMRKAPSYWAQTIDFKYEKGIFSTDTLEVMNTVMEAQKNSDWAAVQEELKTINNKALTYVLEFIKKENLPAKITPSTLFQIIEKEDSIFAINATNMAKFKKIISKMDSLELLAHCFNLEEVKVKATASLDKKKQAEEQLTKAVTKDEKDAAIALVAKINAEVSKATVDMIKNLDLSVSFTKSLNKIFSPNLAFELKTLIRDKVVGQLAAADQAAVKELLPSFSHEEVKLLVEFIRALSSNEKEDMSRTGVQYRGLTSKGQQRDVAAAVHSRQLAKTQNVINSQAYHQLKPKEREALLNKLNESLKVSGEEKEKTFKSFEETKKKYDDRVKAGINFVTSVALKFVTMPLETIPFLGTAIEAAVSAIVESVTDKVLGGDRAGSWKTVLATGGKKFLLKLAKGIISEAAPMLLNAALGEAGLASLEKGGNQLSETFNNIVNSNQKISDAVKSIQDTVDKIQKSKLGEFIKNAQKQIETFKETIEENYGLVGKVAIKVVEEQVDSVKESIGEKVNGFREKLFNKIDGQRGYLNGVYSTFETAYGYYETAQSALEAIRSINAKNRLEKFQEQNPELAGDDLVNALKAMDDFKDLEDEDWEKITSYADMTEKLEGTFNEFVSGQVSDFLDPKLDAAFGEGDEEAEEDDEEQDPVDKTDAPQLSAKAPTKSLLKIREALSAQGKAIPKELNELIDALSKS